MDNISMREALEAARDLLLPQCNGGTAFAKACGETVNKIMDVLAAPPRNCDRFATVKDAAIAFARERKDAPHPCPDFTFSAWLFEPAAKKEGGAK